MKPPSSFALTTWPSWLVILLFSIWRFSRSTTDAVASVNRDSVTGQRIILIDSGLSPYPVLFCFFKTIPNITACLRPSSIPNPRTNDSIGELVHSTDRMFFAIHPDAGWKCDVGEDSACFRLTKSQAVGSFFKVGGKQVLIDFRKRPSMFR